MLLFPQEIKAVDSFWVKKKIRSDQGRLPEKSPVGVNGPDDPTFQRTSVGVSSEFYIQNNLKTAG